MEAVDLRQISDLGLEEGVEIAKKCSSILNDCKGKVVILKKELENLLPSEQEDDDE